MATWELAELDPGEATRDFAKAVSQLGRQVSELDDGKMVLQQGRYHILAQVKTFHVEEALGRILIIAPLPFVSDGPEEGVHSLMNYLNGKYDAGSFHKVGDTLVFMTHLPFRASLDMALFDQFVKWIGAFLDNLLQEEGRYMSSEPRT